MGKYIQLPSAEILRSMYCKDLLTTPQIATKLGVGITTIGRWFAMYGIDRRPPGNPNPLKPTCEELHRLYIDERKSSADIARRFNCTICTACKWLKEYGIPTRSFSEAASLKMSTRTYEEKLRNSAVGRSTDAFKTHTHERRCKMAKTRQTNNKMSEYEEVLYSKLIESGIVTLPGYAIDKYNIDLAIPSSKIAIEVDGGNWHHNHPRKMAQDKAKTEYLESDGWAILRFSNWRNPKWADEAVSVITAALLLQ